VIPASVGLAAKPLASAPLDRPPAEPIAVVARGAAAAPAPAAPAPAAPAANGAKNAIYFAPLAVPPGVAPPKTFVAPFPALPNSCVNDCIVSPDPPMLDVPLCVG